MIFRRHKYNIIVLSAIVVLLISFFLAITKSQNIQVPCGFTGGCEFVLTSKYSQLLGVPLFIWGIAYSILIIVTALLANSYKNCQKFLTWFLGFGAVLALTFLGLQIFILKNICQYCLVVDSLIILTFLFDVNVDGP